MQIQSFNCNSYLSFLLRSFERRTSKLSLLKNLNLMLFISHILTVLATKFFSCRNFIFFTCYSISVVLFYIIFKVTVWQILSFEEFVAILGGNRLSIDHQHLEFTPKQNSCYGDKALIMYTII